MSLAPKLPWFRFSLRTLFVLATLVGALSAYGVGQWHWVLQRQAFLADPKMCVVAEPRPNARAPGLLWIFRECSWSSISIATHSKFPPASEHDLARARRLFPEARVSSKLYGPNWDGDIEAVYRRQSWELPP